MIPQKLVSTRFGSGHVYGVPLAASLGLPFYINTEASLPLVRSLLDLGGMQFELEALLGRHVDVVTERGLRPRIRDRVLREAVPL